MYQNCPKKQDFICGFEDQWHDSEEENTMQQSKVI